MKRLKAILIMVDGMVVDQKIVEITVKNDESPLDDLSEDALYFFY